MIEWDGPSRCTVAGVRWRDCHSARWSSLRRRGKFYFINHGKENSLDANDISPAQEEQSPPGRVCKTTVGGFVNGDAEGN